MERMANNLEVAGRQRTTVNGRTARLRSALELLNMVNPNNVNCIMQVARFYMQYNLNVSALRQALEHNIQVYYLIKFLFLTFITQYIYLIGKQNFDWSPMLGDYYFVCMNFGIHSNSQHKNVPTHITLCDLTQIKS